MIHEIDLSRLPDVTDIYSVRRRTVWQIVDPDTLLIFAAEGRCTITMDNREYALDEGHLVFVPARQHYLRRPVGDEMCTLYYAHIRLDGDVRVLEGSEVTCRLDERRQSLTRELIMGSRISRPDHRCMIAPLTDLSERREEVVALWEAAMAADGSNRIDGHTRASLAVMQLLLMAALPADTSAPPSDGEESGGSCHKLRQVVSYIRLHSKENISLDDLCGVCNFSKQHLIRLFREELGKTPGVYILEHKVNCAKELFFRDPYLSVKEVAEEMGFADQHYFSRAFGKVTGQSPTAYKRHLLTFDPDKQ